jgi:hypothetical protein
MTPSWFLAAILIFIPTSIFQILVPLSATKRERTLKKSHFLNFWDKQSDFGFSLAKNFSSEESTGEEFSASRDFFQAKNNCSEEFSGEESFERRTFRRRIFLAKKFPSEESSGEELFGRRILRRKNLPRTLFSSWHVLWRPFQTFLPVFSRKKYTLKWVWKIWIPQEKHY